MKWQRYVLVGLFGAATVVLFIGAVRAQASKEALMLALLGAGFAGHRAAQGGGCAATWSTPR
ncbi:MAG: hypothetical protein WAV45_13360 [Propionibacteriaceae bacterium]|nr:hypothetical protein [Micropruina sp.]